MALRKISKTQEQQQEEQSGVLQQPSFALHVVNRYLRWIILLVAAVAVWISYTFVISAQIADVRDVAQNSLDQKERTLQVLTSIKTDLTKIVLDFNSIMEQRKEQVTKLDELLPRRSKYEDLFTQINILVEQTGMKLTNIGMAFDDDTAGELTRDSIQDAAVPARTQEAIKKMTMHISVEGGTYDTLKLFLSNFEKSVRLYDLQSISFDGASFIPNAEGVLPIPHYDLEITTYYQS